MLKEKIKKMIKDDKTAFDKQFLDKLVQIRIKFWDGDHSFIGHLKKEDKLYFVVNDEGKRVSCQFEKECLEGIWVL